MLVSARELFEDLFMAAAPERVAGGDPHTENHE